MILNYYVQCIKMKTNNTKTNNPSLWGSIPAAPRQQLPGARSFSSAEAVLRHLRLAALDVPICLLLADARNRSCHFIGCPPELLIGVTRKLIVPHPRSDEAPAVVATLEMPFAHMRSPHAIEKPRRPAWSQVQRMQLAMLHHSADASRRPVHPRRAECWGVFGLWTKCTLPKFWS